jgi:hypothetical protein
MKPTAKNTASAAVHAASADIFSTLVDIVVVLLLTSSNRTILHRVVLCNASMQSKTGTCIVDRNK